MKKITAYVRSERALVLKEEFGKIGIRAVTIGDITAWASSKKVAAQRRGIPISYDLVHMAKIECYIVDDKTDQVVNMIIDNTKSGELGDGIITVSDIEQVINISTLRKNEGAVLEP